MFPNHVSDEGLASKIKKELLQLDNKQTNNPAKKWLKDLNRHFPSVDIEKTSKHMKRHLTLFPSRKCKSNPQGDTTSHSLEWP